MEIEAEVVPRRDPLWLGSLALFLVASMAGIVIGSFLTMVPISAILWSTVAAATAVCVLATVWLSPRPLSWRTACLPALMGVLAALAPVGLLAFMRLSGEGCVWFNYLGLPQAEPWREVVHWGGGLVWLASSVLIVVGLFFPRLRNAALAMMGWSGLSVTPTILLMFLMSFGDPVGDCLPA